MGRSGRTCCRCGCEGTTAVADTACASGCMCAAVAALAIVVVVVVVATDLIGLLLKMKCPAGSLAGAPDKATNEPRPLGLLDLVITSAGLFDG